ncbi:MAG: diguanylate cyclase [Synergistaceae bacterium]|nr:diguanylate cyclase [Synergistaceae bacterium]
MILLTLFAAFLLCAAARSSCAADRVVRVGFFHFPGYHMTDLRGNRSGYGYDYLHNLANWTDWTYSYVGYDRSWGDMLKMLDDGEIDLVTSVRKTPERTAKYLFSNDPIGISWSELVVRMGDPRFHVNDLKNLDGIRVGMLKGNSRNDSFAKFAKANGFTYKPVYFDGPDSTTKLSDALKSGRAIDAAITSNLRAASNEWVLARFDPEPFYIITRKNSGGLMDEINAAIKKLAIENPNLSTELMNKYYTPGGGEHVALTAEEATYLAALKKSGVRLKGVMKPNRFPLSDFDKDDKPIGIVADIIRIVSEQIGVPIDIIDLGSEEKYEEFVLTKDVPLRLDTGIFYNDADAEKIHLTVPYLPIGVSGIGKTHVMERNDRIAALRHSRVTNKYVNERFSPSQIVFYDTPEQCIKAVQSGAVKLTFFDRYSAEKIVMDDYSGILKPYTVMDFSADLSIAVSRTMPKELHSILSKAIKSIHVSQLESIVIKNNNYDVQEITVADIYDKYKLPIYIIGGLFAMCILLLSVLFVHQRMLIRARAKANKLNEELEEMNKLLSHQAITDELTGLNNRRFFINYLEGIFTRLGKDDQMTLTMFDLDHFKDVNDAYGHVTGNRVLANFANMLRVYGTGGNIAVRYGGEEFMLLMPGATLEKTMRIAEEVRRRTEEEVCIPGSDEHITISGGVAVWKYGMSRVELVSLADAKMYDAKKSGRNNITC